jgi:hypothetical protein
MAPKVKHPDRVRKLLKRSARFRRRVQKALERHESGDVIKFNQLVDAIDQVIVRSGRARARKKR